MPRRRSDASVGSTKVIIRKSTNRNDKRSNFLVGSSDKPHNRAVAETPKNA
nr:MAG TPA: hypothetical protein [Caudoviricetes sp.]